MERNGIPTLLLFSSLLILIFCNFSNAASLISTIRRLADVKNNSSDQIQVSPSPIPADPVKINPTINTTKSQVDNSTKSQTNNNNTGIVGPTPTTGNETGRGNEKGDMARENEKRIERLKERSKANEPEVWENCTEVSRRCTDQKSMTACIVNFDADDKSVLRSWSRKEIAEHAFPRDRFLEHMKASEKCLILIQNAGEDALSVSISASNPIDDSLIEIQKHKSKKNSTALEFVSCVDCDGKVNVKRLFKKMVQFSMEKEKLNLTVGERTEVILNAKHGECVLHLAPHVSQDNLFMHLPSYDQVITPINGAYFLIIVVVFGGMCAFCMFRRRRQVGIAYQELEMSMPESGLANDADARRGWDQDWDDDWDEENAIKSPAARHSASISANGLTSRSQNKDGWDSKWDD